MDNKTSKKTSPARLKANRKSEALNRVKYNVNMDNRLHDVLQDALIKRDISRNAYTVEAIKAQLVRDGYDLTDALIPRPKGRKPQNKDD